jgi:hypothetical protein
MPETPGDASLGELPENQIPALAELYDKFAQTLDPFSSEADRAEAVFNQEVASWHSLLVPPKPSFHEFRKAVILRCKRYLKANSKPPSF